MKGSGGLGFTLSGGANTVGGCFVRDIVSGPAKEDGRLQQGDQILMVRKLFKCCKGLFLQPTLFFVDCLTLCSGYAPGKKVFSFIGTCFLKIPFLTMNVDAFFPGVGICC